MAHQRHEVALALHLHAKDAEAVRFIVVRHALDETRKLVEGLFWRAVVGLGHLDGLLSLKVHCRESYPNDRLTRRIPSDGERSPNGSSRVSDGLPLPNNAPAFHLYEHRRSHLTLGLMRKGARSPASRSAPGNGRDAVGRPSRKRSADGVGGRYGIFPSAEAAIAEALHTSACEGRTVPANEVEDLWKVVRGEISRQDLIKKYVAEALAKEEALERL